MGIPAKKSLAIALAIIAIALSAFSQQQAASASTSAVSTSYPDTTEGLRHFLQEAIAAAKMGDSAKLAGFVHEMEIPHPAEWFRVAAPDDGGAGVASYQQFLPDHLASVQESLVAIALADGELIVRSVNSDPKGLEPAILSVLAQPTHIYSSSWKMAGGKEGVVGYFYFIQGGFRFMSALNLARMSVPPPAQQKERIRIDPGVSNALLMKHVLPTYPEGALDEGAKGPVHLLAAINTSGDVVSLGVIDGNPLLARAAIDAARQWKFRPYSVDGKDVEFETVITIEFTPSR